jgi:anionic cell wall polymer biosynthesis LytR-Cps2A-Psr (LCP) family protein
MRNLLTNKIFLGVIFFAIFLVGAAVTYFYSKYSKMVVKSDTNMTKFVLPSPQVTDVSKRDETNILLLGYGGGTHEGGSLTDTMMVVSINPKTKKATFVAVPRDLWIDGNKINYAYTVSPGQAKSEVGKVTGLPIDYFVVVDFSGFTKIIDILGGIDVSVPVTFDDNYYPVAGLENETCGKSPEDIAALSATMSGFLLEKQFTCRYEHLHFDKGVTKMDGATALKFVRSRHSETYGSDFARSERQKAVLVAIKNKVISLGVITKADPVLNKISDSVRTDITLQDMSNLLATFGKISDYQTSAIYLNTDNVLKESVSSAGAYVLIPKAGDGNFSEVQKYVLSQLSTPGVD